KFIMELEAQLSDRDVTIQLTDKSREWLAKEGYDKRYGARPLARVIQEHIKMPLSEELLFGELSKGGTVCVSVKDNKIEFEYPKLSLPKGTEKPSRPKGKGGGGKDKKPTELVE
ncbi:MAG: ATP-dependent Clp protease ATP-binding subunit ClpA, partial [Rhodospirillales bacterium]|nr:ATP-dependent Clp protease ATP-binding subunit ClpA [Rhodospirillales bacterium]